MRRSWRVAKVFWMRPLACGLVAGRWIRSPVPPDLPTCVGNWRPCICSWRLQCESVRTRVSARSDRWPWGFRVFPGSPPGGSRYPSEDSAGVKRAARERRGGVVYGGQKAAGGLAFSGRGVWAAVPLDHLASEALFAFAAAAVFSGDGVLRLGGSPAPRRISPPFLVPGRFLPVPGGVPGGIGCRRPDFSLEWRIEIDDAGTGCFRERIDGGLSRGSDGSAPTRRHQRTVL